MLLCDKIKYTKARINTILYCYDIDKQIPERQRVVMMRPLRELRERIVEILRETKDDYLEKVLMILPKKITNEECEKIINELRDIEETKK